MCYYFIVVLFSIHGVRKQIDCFHLSESQISYVPYLELNVKKYTL